MWAIIKIDKKKFELFKIEMKKKLGGECKFYYFLLIIFEPF